MEQETMIAIPPAFFLLCSIVTALFALYFLVKLIAYALIGRRMVKVAGTAVAALEFVKVLETARRMAEKFGGMPKGAAFHVAPNPVPMMKGEEEEGEERRQTEKEE